MATRRAQPGEAKASPYQIVTDKIVALLDSGVVPWRADWIRQRRARPESFVSRKPYRGINHLLLDVVAQAAGYQSGYWLTYHQAIELGGHVRKGEKGCPCFFWKVYDNDRKDQEAPSDEPSDRSRRFVARYYTVFAIEQCEGLERPAPPVPPMAEFTPIEACEKIVQGYKGPAIEFGRHDPVYIPALDTVRMPEEKWFNTAESFYGVFLHELAHSTGHSSRLDRFSKSTPAPFGSEDYSQEELVAEMTAAFLCSEAGIGAPTISNQAAYIAGWMKVLKDDSRAIVMAAAQAEKAADLILGRQEQCPVLD